MTCRHQPGDSSCSSSPYYIKPYEAPTIPDYAKYSIEAVERVGSHLVLRVKYPNCSTCSYEGSKVMVFLHVTEAQALNWRVIDPHFIDPNKKQDKSHAPSPDARFPATAVGWSDALMYARRKLSK